MSKPTLPAPTASTAGPCPTIIQIVGRPGTGSLPSTIAPPSSLPDYFLLLFLFKDPEPGRVAQSTGHLTRQRSWVRYPVWPHTFVSPSADSRGAVVSYWRKYVHEVLVNRLGGLSLPRKSVVRLTDRPDMTLDVYRGRKMTTQQQ